MKKNFWILFCFLAVCIGNSFAQTINVDASIVIKTFDHNPASINLDYLMDDDSYLKPATPLSQTLKNIKIGMLRYPGGEKADNYLWSKSPYSSAKPYFATPGNCNWPNNDSRFSGDYITPLNTTLDFDEFISLCQATGASPLIVVSGDANHCHLCPTTPSLNDLITNAVEWIKYANIKNNYKIKYWMVGNESWNLAAYDKPSTAIEYANDFVQFSKSMKAADPTIKVVANSQPGNWVNTLLQNANGYIDAIAISNYPVYNWTNGYDTYRTGNPSFVSDINSIITSIGNKNIDVIVSEYNSIDWGNAWANNNDLGHALVNFQMLGDQIKIPKVVDAYLWNTRWVDNASNPQHIYDAIDANGNLNATGKALAMWGNNLLDKLVASGNSGFINSFASIDNSGNTLNIFLINKDYSSHSATVTISNYAAITQAGFTISHTKLTGTSATDKSPVISYPTGTTSVLGNTVTVQLGPLSINVIKLKGQLTTGNDEDNIPVQNLVVYPNPVMEKLYVTVEGQLPDHSELKIFNSIGIQVYSKQMRGQKGSIDFAEFPPGMYLVTLDGMKKLIVKY